MRHASVIVALSSGAAFWLAGCGGSTTPITAPAPPPVSEAAVAWSANGAPAAATISGGPFTLSQLALNNPSVSGTPPSLNGTDATIGANVN